MTDAVEIRQMPQTEPPMSKERKVANFVASTRALVDRHFAGIDLNPKPGTNTGTPEDITDRSIMVACGQTSTPGIKLVEANARFRIEPPKANPEEVTEGADQVEEPEIDLPLQPAVRAEIIEYSAINPSAPLTPEARAKIEKRSVLYGHAVSGSRIKIEIVDKPNAEPTVQIEFVYPPERTTAPSEKIGVEDLNEIETEEIEATFGINLNQK